MRDYPNKKPDGKISAMLTTGEVARIFQVNASTIRRWSARGIIKCHRIGPGNSRRFRREDVAVLYLDKAIRKYLKAQQA